MRRLRLCSNGLATTPQLSDGQATSTKAVLNWFGMSCVVRVVNVFTHD
jgi:hypothetical protein